MKDVELEKEKSESVELEKVELKNVVVETLEDNDRKEFEDNLVLSLEAGRMSYLKTLDLDSIENETTRKIIEEVVSSPLSCKDKVESVKKLLTQSAIESSLKKSEHIEDSQVNAFALKTLRSLNNLGKNLSETQIIQAESAIATLDVDFQRIGKENLSRGLDSQVDMGSLPAIQQLNFLMKKYQQKQDTSFHSTSPDSQVNTDSLGSGPLIENIFRVKFCIN